MINFYATKWGLDEQVIKKCIVQLSIPVVQGIFANLVCGKKDWKESKNLGLIKTTFANWYVNRKEDKTKATFE